MPKWLVVSTNGRQCCTGPHLVRGVGLVIVGSKLHRDHPLIAELNKLITINFLATGAEFLICVLGEVGHIEGEKRLYTPPR